MTIEVSIITPSALYVKQIAAKNEKPKKQIRVRHEKIDAKEVRPELRAFGRHIAKCQKKRQRVRIPAMRCSEWGHVLRTLELKRAFV